jgi:transcriptional regulator with XRE-family HTH domain
MRRAPKGFLARFHPGARRSPSFRLRRRYEPDDRQECAERDTGRMDDRRVGRAFREVRIHLGWRQQDVAERAGVSQRHVAEIENGRLEHVSLATLRKVGDTLDFRIGIDAWWRSGRIDHLLDRAHAALVEVIVRAFRDAGWDVRVEYTFNEYGERGSVDILAWHAPTRTLAITEVKTRIDDVQDTNASFGRKVRLIPGIVARVEGWKADAILKVLVLVDTRQNRDLIRRHEATFRSTWPERTVAMKRAVAAPIAGARQRGGIWFVPPTRLGPAARAGSRCRPRHEPPPTTP